MTDKANTPEPRGPAGMDPLPRCRHGSCLVDGAGEILEPACGCRWPTPTPEPVAQRISEVRDKLREAPGGMGPCALHGDVWCSCQNMRSPRRPSPQTLEMAEALDAALQDVQRIADAARYVARRTHPDTGIMEVRRACIEMDALAAQLAAPEE